MEFLWDNAKWVFSGIGVLIVTAVWHLFFSRRKTPVPTGQETATPVPQSLQETSVPKTALQEIKVPETGRFDHKAVVQEGDYVEYAERFGHDRTRLSVKRLVTEDVKSNEKGQEVRAEIEVDGIRAMLCGEAVEELKYNRFLVPVGKSLYHYSIGNNYFSFRRFLIDHINPHTRQITLHAFFFNG